MKTVKISEISYLEADLPRIPDFILLTNGSKFSIADFTTEQLRQIGEAWTEELIQTAQARRGAPRKK